MPMSVKEKVRENLVRRVLVRRGYQLRKSRRRDPEALDFHGYWIMSADGESLVSGGEWGMSLSEVEAWIEANTKRKRGKK